MEVKHIKDKNLFSYKSNGHEAVLNYIIKDNVMVIPHTLVPEALRGKGVANALTEEALSFADKNKYKVDPQCEFVSAFFKRTPEWNKLLA